MQRDKLAPIALAAGLVVAAAAVKLLRRRRNAFPVYVLRNNKGVEAHITPVGATIVKLLVPDKSGKLADVVLGFDDLGMYLVRGGQASGAPQCLGQPASGMCCPPSLL
jgi:hypothetical protein